MKKFITYTAAVLGGALAGVSIMKYRLLKAFYKIVSNEIESE